MRMLTNVVPSITPRGFTGKCRNSSISIKMKVCVDEYKTNEDIAIEKIDIYVH